MLPTSAVYEMRGTSSAPSTCSATLPFTSAHHSHHHHSPTTPSQPHRRPASHSPHSKPPATPSMYNTSALTLHGLPSFFSRPPIPAPPPIGNSPLPSSQQKRHCLSSPMLSSLDEAADVPHEVLSRAYERPRTHFQLAPYRDTPPDKDTEEARDDAEEEKNNRESKRDESPAPRRPARSPLSPSSPPPPPSPSRRTAMMKAVRGHAAAEHTHRAHRQPVLLSLASQASMDLRKGGESAEKATQQTQPLLRHSFARRSLPSVERGVCAAARHAATEEKALMELTSYGGPRTHARPCAAAAAAAAAVMLRLSSADTTELEEEREQEDEKGGGRNKEDMAVRARRQSSVQLIAHTTTTKAKNSKTMTCLHMPCTGRRAAPALRSARSVSLYPSAPTRHVAFDPCSLQEAFLRRLQQKLWRWVNLCGMQEARRLPYSIRGYAQHGLMPLPMMPQVNRAALGTERSVSHGRSIATSRVPEGKRNVQHVVIKVVSVTVMGRNASHHNTCTGATCGQTVHEHRADGSTKSRTAMGRETRLTQPALCTRLLRVRERTIKCVARLVEVLPLAAILYNDDDDDEEDEEAEEDVHVMRGMKSCMRPLARRTARLRLTAQLGSTASQVAAITEDIRRELGAVLSEDMSGTEGKEDAATARDAQGNQTQHTAKHTSYSPSFPHPQATLFLYVRKYIEKAHTLSAALREAWPDNALLHGYYHAVASRSVLEMSEAGLNEAQVLQGEEEDDEEEDRKTSSIGEQPGKEEEDEEEGNSVETARKPFSLDRIADVALQVATGLLHLHEHDLCHGNLKPSNILLRETAQHTTPPAAANAASPAPASSSLSVYLTDFGLPLFPDALIERVPLYVQDSVRHSRPSDQDMYALRGLTGREEYSRGMYTGRRAFAARRCLRGFVRLRKIAQPQPQPHSEAVTMKDAMDASRRPPSDLTSAERTAELILLQHLMAPECCLITCAYDHNNNNSDVQTSEEPRVWVSELRKSPASDAYALGVLLYMMLMGRFPPLPPYAQAVRIAREEHQNTMQASHVTNTTTLHPCGTAVYALQPAPRLNKTAYITQLWAVHDEEDGDAQVVHVDAELKAIVQGLLEPDPSERLDLRQLRCSPFFRQYGQHRFVLQQLHKASHTTQS